MQEQRSRLHCGKHLALASVYDALERLGWTLISVNSEEGLLLAREPVAGITFVIRVSQLETQETEIKTELASGEYATWSLSGESAARLLRTVEQIIEASSAEERPTTI